MAAEKAGRPRKRRAFWAGHMEAWRGSGQSNKAHCRERGPSPASFSRWCQRLGEGGVVRCRPAVYPRAPERNKSSWTRRGADVARGMGDAYRGPGADPAHVGRSRSPLVVTAVGTVRPPKSRPWARERRLRVGKRQPRRAQATAEVPHFGRGSRLRDTPIVDLASIRCPVVGHRGPSAIQLERFAECRARTIGPAYVRGFRVHPWAGDGLGQRWKLVRRCRPLFDVLAEDLKGGQPPVAQRWHTEGR